MKKVYQYSLRFTLDPNSWDDQKQASLIEFCKKGAIDNVVFFINPEELNQGHLTLSQIDSWLKTIEPVAEQLKRINVSMSLNPWTTMMHSDRGHRVNPALGFRTLVDYRGKQAESIACPGDPKWVDYIVSCYARYATLHPKELWLEDDFRHYNHTPLKLGCFCEQHMKQYSKQLGYEITRTEFVRRMLHPGKPTQEREVYLRVAQSEMISVANKIREAVQKVAPETKLGLMSSFPEWHAVEGRDWDGLFDALSGDKPRVSRPHLPAYNEVSPLMYSREFDRYTRQTAALVGPKSEVLPELESYMYSPFVKSASFTTLQLESTAMVGATGILLNLFDMMGNGIDETYRYAQLLKNSKPLMNYIAQNRLQVNQLQGIKVLFSPDSAFKIQTNQGTDPAELVPKEHQWLSLFSTFGIVTKPEVLRATMTYHNEVLAVSGQVLRNLTKLQIKALFENNVVFIDGSSVDVLFENGLENLINATDRNWHLARTAYQSYEQVEQQTLDGIENPRITMLQHTGNYLQITYQDQDVEIISNAYSDAGKKLGPVTTVVNNRTVVLPIDYDAKYGWEAQYYSIKEKLFKQLVSRVTNQIEFVIDAPGVKLVNDGNQMVVTNFTMDSYSELKIQLAQHDYGSSWQVVRRRGEKLVSENIDLAENESGILRIEQGISGLETLILKRNI